MTVNIREVAPVTQVAGFDAQATSRRQRPAIAAILKEIQADLRLDLLQERRKQGEKLNSTTVHILDWHQLFTKVLVDCENPQAEFDKFKGFLQDILVDSLFKSALDENCLLGNDGETYTEMGLQIYRSSVPVQFQNRAPLHPEIVLETSHHEVARYMVRWLKGPHASLRNAQNDILEEAHRKLNLMARRFPPPETDQDEVMRQIMAHEVKKQQEKEARAQALRTQLQEQRKAELTAKVKEGFAPVERKIQEVARKQLDQGEKLDRHVRQEIQLLKPAIDRLDAEIAELSQREEALKEQNHRIEAGIGALRETHRQLEAETIQLQKEIKESEKAGLQSIGSALLTIGLCAAGTWAIKCALSAAGGASGVSVTVKPMNKGALLGADLKF